MIVFRMYGVWKNSGGTKYVYIIALVFKNMASFIFSEVFQQCHYRKENRSEFKCEQIRSDIHKLLPSCWPAKLPGKAIESPLEREDWATSNCEPLQHKPQWSEEEPLISLSISQTCCVKRNCQIWSEFSFKQNFSDNFSERTYSASLGKPG